MSLRREEIQGLDVAKAFERPLKLKNRYLELTKVQVCSERSHLFTEYFRQSDGEPIVLRRAKAFAHVLKNMTIDLRDDELIVGSQTKYVRGCSAYPEFATDWIKKEIDALDSREVQKLRINKEDRDNLLEDVTYWERKSIQKLSEDLWQSYDNSLIQDMIEARIFHDLTPWPQGRCAPGYGKVVGHGLGQLIAEAQQKIKDLVVNHSNDLRKRYFFEAVITCCEGIIRFANRYADLSKEKAAEESDAGRKAELLKIAEVCSWVPENRPRNFQEALQAFWFAHLAIEIENNSAGYTPGRLDQYIYPFFAEDLKTNRMTYEEAAELLGCLWVKFTEIERFRSAAYSELSQSVFQNITVGGQTPEGRDATNPLSYLILDVTENMKLPQPTISLRYFDGIDYRFLMKAAQVVRDWGAGIPAWFNDKVALTTMPGYGISLKEARDWVPIGCVEMGLMGKTPLLLGHGFLSLAKCLELALNDGIDPKTQKRVGPSTGDPVNFGTYEDLFEAFRTQIKHALDVVAFVHNSSYAFHADNVPVPFLSTLMDNCLERGVDLTEGGAKYNTLICWFPREIVDAANSLTAMKKLVFEEKSIGMRDLLDSLASNFEGREQIQRQLLDAPKYGNDDDYADNVVDGVYQLCKDITEDYKNPMGEKLAVGFLGITAHYFFGKVIGALPSGRKAYVPCTDGSLSAFPGTDKKGPTALVKSASKIDFMPGLSTLLNVKTSPQLVKGQDGLRKLLSLIKTYFDLYGYHMQFNVLDKATLIKARENPMEYRDLVVRVAGFSMFWIDLAPNVQDEIIERTEHVV